MLNVAQVTTDNAGCLHRPGEQRTEPSPVSRPNLSCSHSHPDSPGSSPAPNRGAGPVHGQWHGNEFEFYGVWDPAVYTNPTFLPEGTWPPRLRAQGFIHIASGLGRRRARRKPDLRRRLGIPDRLAARHGGPGRTRSASWPLIGGGTSGPLFRLLGFRTTGSGPHLPPFSGQTNIV